MYDFFFDRMKPKTFLLRAPYYEVDQHILVNFYQVENLLTTFLSQFVFLKIHLKMKTLKELQEY